VARWGWGEQIATTTYRGACLGRRHPDGFIWAGYQRMREEGAQPEPSDARGLVGPTYYWDVRD